MTSDSPPDRYKAVWLIFFTLGLGTLLPWNFFMTATRYFTERLADPTDETAVDWKFFNITTREQEYNLTSPKQNNLQAKFNNVMTLCSMLPLLIFTCLNSFLHQRIPQKIRILGSLIVIFVVFLITAIFVKISFEPVTFFVLTMIKIVCINSFGAILQGSLFGLAGVMPSYTTPIMSGQGLAGTFAACAMICAIASGSELEESAFGYFITACVVILLAIVAYITLPKLEFFRHYFLKENISQVNEVNAEHETKISLMNTGEERNPNGKDRVLSKSEDNDGMKPSVIFIFKKLWPMALSVCLVFTVTIGIFPAVTADAKSTIAGTSAWSGYFIPVSCFLLFNVCDWAGRSLTVVCKWPGENSKILHILVIARVVFIPLIMLCNVQPRQHLPVYLGHDAWYILIIIALAFSNGYLASLCMCFGPKKVLAHEAETAGAVMVFFLSLGLALGAAFSFLFRELV